MKDVTTQPLKRGWHWVLSGDTIPGRDYHCYPEWSACDLEPIETVFPIGDLVGTVLRYDTHTSFTTRPLHARVKVDRIGVKI